MWHFRAPVVPVRSVAEWSLAAVSREEQAQRLVPSRSRPRAQVGKLAMQHSLAATV